MTRKRIRTEDDPRVRRVKIPNGLDFDSAALWARRSGVREPVWHVVRPFFEVEVRRLQTIVHYPRADHGDGRYRRNRNHARHATPRVAMQHTQRHRVVIIGVGLFGGLSAAKQLAQAPFDATIVDRQQSPPGSAAA